MSSGLCKNLEGAVPPFQIESVKDRVDNPVDAGHVDEAHHRPGAPPDLHEDPLNHIRRSQLPPQVLRKTEKAQQLRQVPLKLSDHAGVLRTPAFLKPMKGIPCRRAVRRQVDGAGPGFHDLVVPLPDLLQNVPHLAHPALLRSSGFLVGEPPRGPCGPVSLGTRNCPPAPHRFGPVGTLGSGPAAVARTLPEGFAWKSQGRLQSFEGARVRLRPALSDPSFLHAVPLRSGPTNRRQEPGPT